MRSSKPGENAPLPAGRRGDPGAAAADCSLREMRSRSAVYARGPVTPFGVTVAWWPLRATTGSPPAALRLAGAAGDGLASTLGGAELDQRQDWAASLSPGCAH
jgi:hypothetical protein